MQEKKNTQNGKEALRVIFGVTKFHKHIHSRHVRIRIKSQTTIDLFGD